jgi:hypothetical protein
MNYLTFEKDRFHEMTDVRIWCREHFGPGRWIGEQCPRDWTGMPAWTVSSAFGNTTFAFKDDKHYNWFVLRWGT